MVGVANTAKREMQRLAAEFGLSPSARTQIEVDPLRNGANYHSDHPGQCSVSPVSISADERELQTYLPSCQLVTGFGTETPILRRIRETGDAMALQMLIDLYGHIQTDMTHGVSLGVLKQFGEGSDSSRKIAEVGTHAIWSVALGNTLQGMGAWRAKHVGKDKPFWPRVCSIYDG